MKRCFQKLSSLMAAFIFVTLSQAQVSNIKTNVRNDHKSNYSYRSSSVRTTIPARNKRFGESFGESLAASIVGGIIQGIGFVTIEAQKAVLRDKDDYPNTVSFESTLDYGTDLSTLSFNPSIRGNWGILASDIRYSLLHDYTGSLESLDWQVLIVRVPIKNLKLNYGIGFTSLLSPKTTYFESSTGFDLYLINQKLALSTNYRWTNRRNEERYRQEVKFTTDYQLLSKDQFRLSPMIGLSYLNYFKSDEFLMFNVGVKIRIGS